MKISELLDDISSLDLVLPEFQREYVWENEQAKQLMVSLFKNYPTGSLLFWKTNEPPEIKNMKISRDKIGATTLILDGQQRLTTLFLLIKDCVPPYYKDEEINNDPRNLYFNLEDQEGLFQYYLPSIMKNNPFWVSVVDCFTKNIIDVFKIAKEVEQDPEKQFDLANQLMNNLTKLKFIKEKDFPVQIVPISANVDEAIDVFDRVNSLGTKLTDADLALAHICGKWPQARQVMKDKISELSERNFYFELHFMVRCLTGVVKGRALFDTIHDTPQYQLKDGWIKLSKVLDYIVNILPTHANIHSTEDLNSTNVLVPVVVYLTRNDKKFKSQSDMNKFIHWIYAAHTWARYTSQTDQRLDHDISIVLRSENPTTDLIDAIIEQRGRIEVKANDLEGKWIQDPLFKMTYIICKARGAIDWFNGIPLGKPIGKIFQIHNHHIFPQSLLYKSGKFSPENHIHTKIVNEIANRAFLTAESNLTISNSSPRDYLIEIQNKYPGALEKQFIPTDSALWGIDRYKDFLAKRRELIANGINEFISSLIEEAPPIRQLTLQDYISGGESSTLEFKMTMRYDIRTRQVNSALEKVIAKTISGFLNSNEGILIIGVADDGSIYGIGNDLQTLKNKNKDEFERYLMQVIINYLGIAFTNYVHVRFEKKNGKEVCIVNVESCPQPVYLTDNNEKEFYIRVGNSTKPLDIESAHEYIGMHWNS
jgi:hypothetical protein